MFNKYYGTFIFGTGLEVSDLSQNLCKWDCLCIP